MRSVLIAAAAAAALAFASAASAGITTHTASTHCKAGKCTHVATEKHCQHGHCFTHHYKTVRKR